MHSTRMEDEGLCFAFDDQGAVGGGGGGERPRHFGEPQRGRGGRGRPRGPRGPRGERGRGRGGGRDDQQALQRFSSCDNLSRARGDRGFRGRAGRGDNHGRRDHSYDPAQRDSRGGQRGGRGFRGGEGRGGGRGHDRGGRPRHFPIRSIAEIEDMDDATMRLNSQIEDFKVFMSSDSMTHDDATKTLKVLSKVLQNDLQREVVHNILQIVCSSHFLDSHLTSLIQKLPSFLDYRPDNEITETVDFILQLLSQICLRLPSHASKGYLLLLLLDSTTRVKMLLQTSKPDLAEGVKNLLKECQECMNSMQSAQPTRESGARARRRGPNEDDEVPPEEFYTLPIFPNAKDIDCSERVFLRANKEEGAFRDIRHYLDVQFRLLREDYIRPLRKGIRDFKQLRDKGEAFKSHDLRMYRKVQIIGIICKDSLEHRVQFEMTPQLKRVRWQSSKRLLFGSLVCLSVDDFDTVFFAVVTNRDIKDIEKGIIQIRFESGLEDILDLSAKETFTMAETTAYFEAYRHVLEGLREMKDSVPMSRYLVKCSAMIKPPEYLLRNNTLGRMDLTALLKDRSTYKASSVMVIKQDQWPPVEKTTLNASQMQAMQTALSKELAIIQGPPGTGKTYVGLKVAEVLLKNRQVWNDIGGGRRPMLVVCYTNHALDQFLEGILGFCPEDIVRVGSRCKNPQLEQFNLKNIRRAMRSERKTSLSVRNGIRDSLRSLEALKTKIDMVSSKLQATTKGIISLDCLATVIHPHHLDSFSQRTHGHEAVSNKKMVMMEWLTKGAITQAAQGEDEDPYPVLAADVTAKILQGGKSCPDYTMDPDSVHTRSTVSRAQMYRFWQEKAKQALEKTAQWSNPAEAQKWNKKATQEILPDHILQLVVSPSVFSAITLPMRQQLDSQSNYYIRAWLGVSDRTSPEVMSHILGGQETCHQGNFTAQDVITIPPKIRIHLYRFWLKELERRTGITKKTLKLAETEILDDEVLGKVVDSRLLDAIRQDMRSRQQRQSQHLIRGWLGVQDFCQNASELARVLDELEEEKEEEVQDEEADLNVDEEADVIQAARHLDVDDDDDDLFQFQKKRPGSSFDVQTAMQELGVQSTSHTSSFADAVGGFSVPKYQQKKQARKVQHLMTSCEPMTEKEERRVTNLWSDRLRVEDRVRLYLLWLRRYQDSLRQSVKAEAEAYNREARKLQELRLGEDKDILQQAAVIGMTTTGAARYRRVLNTVACPIIILEEAAEVLEAHVVTTLHQKCQHLILIGDHQQLKPSPTVYELSLFYKLDLSLFERLIKNRLHHSTLAVQHRMRPDVANFVRHVYPQLRDHGTTFGRPHIRGTERDVFFFHHEVEETRNDETSSKSNQHEAELCVGLCRYLLLQGYPSDTITILTAYTGQVFTLKNVMKKDKHIYQGVRVTAVDNYQGEENDIIILSLVRSNQQGTVGFLGTDNRVCVALSRARDGFYAFGNFKILAESSELWRNICKTAKTNGQLGDSLLLRCESHPEQETKITTAKDFDKIPEGGCKLPCEVRLACGHRCELSCHGYDRDHVKYKCRKPCERVTCKLGHACTKKCHEDCGECKFKMEKVVPMCGHSAQMDCSKDPHTWTCRERCKGRLPCGHQCSGKCWDCLTKKTHVMKCTEQEERRLPCGHVVAKPCHVPPEEWFCDRPCETTLSCGHKCRGSCGRCWAGRVHVACQEKCGLPLPACGHKCPLPCGTTCLPCVHKSCATACHHSLCKQPCGVPCLPCNERCPWKSCKHKECESLCCKPCLPCDQPCLKKLMCGPSDETHLCSGMCGENCFCIICQRKNFIPMEIEGVLNSEESQRLDENTRLIKLPRCGHIFNVRVLDFFMQKRTEKLPAGESVCCPVSSCNKLIQEQHCWRYHALFRERHARFQKIKADMVKSTSISESRRQKLQASLDLLTHKAEAEKSFASQAARNEVFKNRTIDINTAFALTNQIKLARVFEMSLECLKKFSLTHGVTKETKDIPVLQKLLYTPMKHMTPQRLRELSSATKRFAYTVQLLCAKRLLNTGEFSTLVEASLRSLDQDPGSEALEKAEGVLKKCALYCGDTWKSDTQAVVVSILDAPPEKDLCDIVQHTHTVATSAAESHRLRVSRLLASSRSPETRTEALTSRLSSTLSALRLSRNRASGSEFLEEKMSMDDELI